MKPPNLITKSAVQDEWWKRLGIVYFFAAGTPPVAVKIGVTSILDGKSLESALRQRFRSIQSSNHETVELIGIVRFSGGQYPTRDAEVLERELHIRFAKLQRFKQHTVAAEWFNASAELLEQIAALTEKPEMLGLPRVIAQATRREFPVAD